jgi:hypothetical protein
MSSTRRRLFPVRSPTAERSIPLPSAPTRSLFTEDEERGGPLLIDGPFIETKELAFVSAAVLRPTARF